MHPAQHSAVRRSVPVLGNDPRWPSHWPTTSPVTSAGSAGQWVFDSPQRGRRSRVTAYDELRQRHFAEAMALLSGHVARLGWSAE
jgi:hypothetical protein